MEIPKDSAPFLIFGSYDQIYMYAFFELQTKLAKANM